jgi:hypothetical protein
MTSESENFEQLRRLLALNRNEIPPPGYFHHFSREVIVRIKAGDRGDGAGLVVQGSWFQRLWSALDTRPVWAGAFGMVVCGFFAIGAMVASEGVDNAIALSEAPATGATLLSQVGPTESSWQQVQAEPVSLESSSLPTPRGSLFEAIQNAQHSEGQTFNVNFVPSGN